MADNLSALEDLFEEMRNRDGVERHLLFEKALELIHTCQAMIDEEEKPA